MATGALAERVVHGVGARRAGPDWTARRIPWHNGRDWLGLSELEAVTRVPEATPGPHPASESAPYATRTRCPSPAPRLWTLPLPWTQESAPIGACKTRADAVSHSAHSFIVVVVVVGTST